ncbi:methylmalonyl-CoA mutase cobalamin-binding subunit [Flavobacterium sp. W4I14]|nr:methylmalonyl-CoA mutase cobalamin-binding subunit [Flavobacterium sp. W4I14]
MKSNTEHDGFSIATYVINMQERTDRLAHILRQFKDRPEFDVTVLEACKHEIGAVGLWYSILKMIKLALENDDDVIIMCEDDHEFTEYYNAEYLMQNIIASHEQGVAILCGGIAGYGEVVPLTENRYWLNTFLSTQFIVLYKKIFKKILNYKFKDDDVADLVLANLTSHKMVLYPFISRQKDFGYSDITTLHNEQPGLVQNMFNETEQRLEKIRQAYLKYLM